MKHRPALYALIRLHGELQGSVKQHRAEAARQRSDMRHVEHVIKLLEPGFNITGIAARRKYAVNPLFRHKKMIASILAVLRAADHPLSVREISAQLIERHITRPMTHLQRKHFGSNVTKALKRYPGIVFCEGERPQRWSLIRS